MALDYTFSLSSFNFMINGLLTKQEDLNLFQPNGPGEADTKNPELEEMRRPEWLSQVSLSVVRGPASFTWRTQYMSSQVLGYEDGGEVETVRENFGSEGWSGDIYFHDMFGTYEMDNGLSFFAGVDNVTDKDPFSSERAYPVSPVGRYFWAGFNYKMGAGN